MTRGMSGHSFQKDDTLEIGRDPRSGVDRIDEDPEVSEDITGRISFLLQKTDDLIDIGDAMDRIDLCEDDRLIRVDDDVCPL